MSVRHLLVVAAAVAAVGSVSGGPFFIEPQRGTVEAVQYGNEEVVTVKSNSTLSVTGSGTIDILLVGGGGGGGNGGYNGAGGGGGGGGASRCVRPANGGKGGGGRGGIFQDPTSGEISNDPTRNNGAPGQDFTGGGGGGGTLNATTKIGGNGGCGIVILRHRRRNAEVDPTVVDMGVGKGGSVVKRHGFGIHTFAESGTFELSEPVTAVRIMSAVKTAIPARAAAAADLVPTAAKALSAARAAAALSSSAIT